MLQSAVQPAQLAVKARLGPKGFAVADTSILKLCATQPGALGYRDLRAPGDLTPLSIARKWTKLSSSGQIVLLAGASASLAAAQVREATVIGKPKATVISLLEVREVAAPVLFSK